MKLPEQKTPPRTGLDNVTIMLYGQGGIGKSTLCSNMDNAFFMACEAGLSSLDVYQEPITSWAELMQCSALIKQGKHPFKTIIVDTLDKAYLYCTRFVLEKYNVEHVSDLKWGKGAAVVNQYFQEWLNKMMSLPYGLVLVSHSKQKELKKPERTVTTTTLPPSANELVMSAVDIVLFCDIEESGQVKKRVMRTKNHPDYDAKDRTGKLPEMMDLDWSKFKPYFEQPARKESK